MKNTLFALTLVVAACAAQPPSPSWPVIEPLFVAVAHEQENADFCGWQNQRRADAKIARMKGALKRSAEFRLHSIREEYLVAEAEYVCTPERLEFLKTEADDAIVKWQALNNGW